jgi:hypothetical protein
MRTTSTIMCVAKAFENTLDHVLLSTKSPLLTSLCVQVTYNPNKTSIRKIAQV